MSPFWDSVLQPPITALGGIFHNAVVKRGYLSGGFKIGQSVIGYLGLLGAVLGAGLDMQKPRSKFGTMANAFGSGMFSEGINMPGVEGLVTVPTLNATAGNGQGVANPVGYGLNPYITSPHQSSLGMGVF
jgi:hypothetical protein